MSKYSVTLKKDNKTVSTYNIDGYAFIAVERDLRPYCRNDKNAKKVKCIDLGLVFRCAKSASLWLVEEGLLKHCSANGIKQACRGKQKTSYGYRWEFVETSDLGI